MDVKCAIRSVDLPGVPDLELKGLIVVVGPNSSGKTQFLHDLNEAVCGKPRQLVVASAVTFGSPPPFEEYFKFLLDRGTIRESSPDRFSSEVCSTEPTKVQALFASPPSKPNTSSSRKLCRQGRRLFT